MSLARMQVVVVVGGVSGSVGAGSERGSLSVGRQSGQIVVEGVVAVGAMRGRA